MYANVIRPLGAHAYMSISGHLLQPPSFPIAGITVVASHNSDHLRAHRLAIAFKGCHDLITAAEARADGRYGWIIRMRTDTVPSFTWASGSVWAPPPPRVRIVYTTHCQGGRGRHFFPGNNCAEHLPYEEPCLSDQFAVLSRAALEPYFAGLLKDLNDVGATNASRPLYVEGWTRPPPPDDESPLAPGDPPECELGAALSRRRVMKRALKLCGCNACANEQHPKRFALAPAWSAAPSPRRRLLVRLASLPAGGGLAGSTKNHREPHSLPRRTTDCRIAKEEVRPPRLTAGSARADAADEARQLEWEKRFVRDETAAAGALAAAAALDRACVFPRKRNWAPSSGEDPEKYVAAHGIQSSAADAPAPTHLYQFPMAFGCAPS